MADQNITININGDGAQPAKKATKPWDEETIAEVVVKADAELRETLAVAYPADRADTAKALDGHRDFASKEAVRRAAHAFLEKSRDVGLDHADGTSGAGTVVESYIWPAGDWTPDGAAYTVKEGDWLVKTRWTPEAWAKIKDGEVTGISMQGKARRAKASPEQVAALRS